MNLYMVSLGGKVKDGNIEVHDVQFVAANHIDETIELLKNRWYGLAEKLHMDSYKVVTGADRYAVQLVTEKQESSLKLFFVQLGGYKKNSTQELHDVGLFVGDSEEKVKDRALEEIAVADIDNHIDSIVNVDSSIMSIDGESYFVELIEALKEFDREPDWFGYRRLDI